MKWFKKILRTLGPGLITGVADDDPSGIATYTQAGAKFGYHLLWAALCMLPLQIAIQEACGRIGAVNGKGIAAVITKHYSKKVLYFLLSLMLISNIINIGANIGAMAAAAKLIIPINFVILTLFFTLITLVLEIFISYKNYVKYLKWLCLTLLAYPITVFMVKEPWLIILKSTLIPHIEFSFQFLFILTGLLGTTISPYLFFWQASQEVEEVHRKHLIDHNGIPKINKRFIFRLRLDTILGMLFSQIGSWCMMVVAATILHTNGIIDINSAADAAKALEPFVKTFPHSGYLAKVIFAVGIIGLGLLSIPVLAVSAAYAIGEAFNWRVGLNLRFKMAHGFYGVIIIATLVGLSINFMGINPIKALIYSAVINGIAAVPIIFIIALIAKDKKIMGKYHSGILSIIFVGLTFILMTIAAVMMFIAYIV